MTDEAHVQTVSNESPIEVRFEVKGKVIDIAAQNRLTRRLLEGQAEKFRKKYADKVGPNGERPTIILRKPDLVGLKLDVVLEFPESMKDSIQGSEKAVRVS